MLKKLLSLALITALLTGLLSGAAAAADNGNGGTGAGGFVPGEVLAEADSWEHARQISEFYGLELKSYAQGIAVMSAPNPELAVNRSGIMRRAGIPPLSYNLIYTSFSSHSDVQWHHGEMNNTQSWELTAGAGVLVAVIDSGIDLNRPAFTGRISE
ncbi:MAG: hypothetical protein FWH24_05920, partial [Oscillospiraceae bacterium]|nr:hypothetical protein [Oscillospiraceae bacterium]